MKASTLCLVFILILGFVAPIAHAVPKLISYQGILKDSLGNPVTEMTVIAFTFWDAPFDGNQLAVGFTDYDNVNPNDAGIFSTEIGDSNYQIPESLFENDTVYVNVNIDGEDMSPRKKISAAAYAIYAGNLTCTGCVDGTDLASNSVDADHIVDGAVTDSKLDSDLKVSFYAYGSSSQTVTDETETKIIFDSEFHDDGDHYDTTTGLFTAPAGGVYHFNAYVSVALASGGAITRKVALRLKRNGVLVAELYQNPDTDGICAMAAGGMTIKLIAGQTISIYVYQSSGGDRSTVGSYATCWFSGHRIY